MDGVLTAFRKDRVALIVTIVLTALVLYIFRKHTAELLILVFLTVLVLIFQVIVKRCKQVMQANPTFEPFYWYMKLFLVSFIVLIPFGTVLLTLTLTLLSRVFACLAICLVVDYMYRIVFPVGWRSQNREHVLRLIVSAKYVAFERKGLSLPSFHLASNYRLDTQLVWLTKLSVNTTIAIISLQVFLLSVILVLLMDGFFSQFMTGCVAISVYAGVAMAVARVADLLATLYVQVHRQDAASFITEAEVQRMSES